MGIDYYSELVLLKQYKLSIFLFPFFLCDDCKMFNNLRYTLNYGDDCSCSMYG